MMSCYTCLLLGLMVHSIWQQHQQLHLHTCRTTGTLLAFSTSLAMYMALRVIIGFASMTVAVVSFVLVVELVSGKWRTVVGILNILPVAVTYVLTASISYFIRDWRTLQLAISLPWFAILCIWYVAYVSISHSGPIHKEKYISVMLVILLMKSCRTKKIHCYIVRFPLNKIKCPYIVHLIAEV